MSDIHTQAEIEDSGPISVPAGTCQSAAQAATSFGCLAANLSLFDPCTQVGVADG